MCTSVLPSLELSLKRCADASSKGLSASANCTPMDGADLDESGSQLESSAGMRESHSTSSSSSWRPSSRASTTT
eukprot:284816-Pleurochrysis_carterae.AAC.2